MQKEKKEFALEKPKAKIKNLEIKPRTKRGAKVVEEEPAEEKHEEEQPAAEEEEAPAEEQQEEEPSDE